MPLPAKPSELQEGGRMHATQGEIRITFECDNGSLICSVQHKDGQERGCITLMREPENSSEEIDSLYFFLQHGDYFPGFEPKFTP